MLMNAHIILEMEAFNLKTLYKLLNSDFLKYIYRISSIYLNNFFNQPRATNHLSNGNSKNLQ